MHNLSKSIHSRPEELLFSLFLLPSGLETTIPIFKFLFAKIIVTKKKKTAEAADCAGSQPAHHHR